MTSSRPDWLPVLFEEEKAMTTSHKMKASSGKGKLWRAPVGVLSYAYLCMKWKYIAQEIRTR